MNYTQLMEEIGKLGQENTEEAYNKIIELIDKFLVSLEEKSIISQFKETSNKDTIDLKGLAMDAKEANDKEEISKQQTIKKAKKTKPTTSTYKPNDYYKYDFNNIERELDKSSFFIKFSPVVKYSINV